MIIDGHSHMITRNIINTMNPNLKAQNIEALSKRLGKEWTEKTVEDHKKEWLAAMDKNNIEKTVFMATSPLNKDFLDFIKSSDRLIGFAKVNPQNPDALLKLQQEIKEGMKGVKIYATGDACDVGAKECYPIYEYCAKNHIPITIHFGVTIGPNSDLSMGNPLMISSVLKEFPEVNFIIAHFGAGFFREVLMLKYKQDNLFVDTSGTNNWLDYQDNKLTLKDIFEKTIKVFTTKGLIYGSDTRIFPDGYREHILKQQIEILDELKLNEEEKQDIMYDNAKRVFGI